MHTGSVSVVPSPEPHGGDRKNSNLTLAGVLESLQHPGWQGFSLLRRFLIEQPGERRRLLRALDLLPWQTRTDLATRQVRIAFCGSFSTTNLSDAVRLAVLDRGLIPLLTHAPFNQLSLIVRDEARPLFADPLDLAVVAVTPEDRGIHLGGESERGSVAGAQQFLDELMVDIMLLHERSGAAVLLHNFMAPEFRPAGGLLDWRQPNGVLEWYQRLNLLVLERCRDIPWLHLVDITRAWTLSGARWPTLHQLYFMGAYRIPEALAPWLAQEYAAVAAARKGLVRKCLVMDLDNTLWGGVVGEDGVAALLVGGSYPGNIYQDLHRVILRLFDRGVILAINSKNNEPDAWAPFAQREEMVLRRQHFSAWRVNWHDKVSNLRELAHELGIGLDSMVVLDDSPTERAWIEDQLPEVYVLPAQDPLSMLRLLSTTHLFDSLESTAEDRLRAQSYAAAAQRRELQSTATTLDEFLAQLHIEVTVNRPSESHLSRVAQLTQRTNQFNLTTRRYTYEQVHSLWRGSDTEVLCCAVRDKFGDEGLVGVVIIHTAPDVWEIDTFLLSCRVLGRGVEHALLAVVCQRAAAAGARRLYGVYRRTEKNGQTEWFYRDAGFTLRADDGQESHWMLSLPTSSVAVPRWVTLHSEEEDYGH